MPNLVLQSDGPPRGAASPRSGGLHRHLAVAGLLVIAAAILRAPLLAPSTLFQDDAWVALTARAAGMGEALLIGPTAPGFSLLLWGWFSLAGFSSLTAQAIPFVAGSLTPGLVYLAGRDRDLHPLAAGFAGALLAVSPTHISMSARVKQFTLEGLLGIGLILAAGRVIDRPAARDRWGALAVLTVLSILTSSVTAVLGAAAFVAGALATLLDRSVDRRPMLVTGATTALLAGAWYLVYLRPRLTEQLRGFWTERYLSLPAGPGAVEELWEAFVHVSEWFTALPPPLLGALVLMGLVVLLVRRPPLAVLLAGPLALLAVLAALHLAPLGGGRTDAFAYPALALLIAAGLDPVARSRRRAGRIGLALLLAALLLWPGAAPSGEEQRPRAGRPGGVLVEDWPYPARYPLRDLAPLITQLEVRRRPQDATVLGPMTLWPYALYTSRPIDIRRGRSLPGIEVGFGGDKPIYLWRQGMRLRDTIGTAPRAWILVGPLRSGVSPEREAELRQLGFVRTDVTSSTDARLELWSRQAAGDGAGEAQGSR